MVRRVDAFFPQRERPEGNIIDRGYIGQAHVIHVEEGDITAVNDYVRSRVPPDSYVSVVAYGKAFVSSPAHGPVIARFPEHRTILRYVPYRQFFSKYYQDRLRENARQYYNPATELHEIDYFAIRYKQGRFGGAPGPQPATPPGYHPAGPEVEEHRKRSRRAVPKRYRE